MKNEKIDNLLNLALTSTPEEFAKSPILQTGFDSETKTWEVVVKYAGDLQNFLQRHPRIGALELLFQYAILQIPENLLDAAADDDQIIYMEKPKSLFFADHPETSLLSLDKMGNSPPLICTQLPGNLTGAGVLIAIIDSGIDYAHPDFRTSDGSTRILYLWDQTLNRIYDQAQINEALAAPSLQEGYRLVPSRDLSGHGTHVAGIAAGNGRGSEGRYVGQAPEASLLIVKLGNPRPEAFPRTTELMSAVDFSLRRAYELQLPLVINLSFGNNYGSHDGSSLLETYLTEAVSYWKSLIVAGTGNEGDAPIHVQGILPSTSEGSPSAVTSFMTEASALIPFSVSDFNTGFNIQLWKNYADEMSITLLAPDGSRLGTLQSNSPDNIQHFYYGKTEILTYYGMPSPYSVSQEIFFDFIPQENYIDMGIWNLAIIPQNVREGRYDLWLPSGAVVDSGNGFLLPSPDTTLTIPSTAAKILSVGAYNSRTLSMAPFSGRGYTRGNHLVKPDIVAPGVGIISAAPGGGYTARSGTSMAAPYASGLAAKMMELGILRGQDPFLYGSKLIARMHRMARPLPGYDSYPNPLTGWGRI